MPLAVSAACCRTASALEWMMSATRCVYVGQTCVACASQNGCTVLVQ
jgi:hypothetical protein